MGFATPSLHDARASRDGLAIRSRRGTRANLSQGLAIVGASQAPWRLPALHWRDGKRDKAVRTFAEADIPSCAMATQRQQIATTYVRLHNSFASMRLTLLASRNSSKLAV